MTLQDYHRRRHEEELSWDRVRLRRDAGAAFITAVEPLLSTTDPKWDPGGLVRIVRERSFDDCVQLCDLYRGATDRQRTWVRSRIDRKIGGKLGAFGLRAAVLGAREQSLPLARASLTAFVIEDLTPGDIRDVLIAFSLVCHCAGLAGANVPALLREVGALAGPAMRALYEDWAERYPNVQQIGSMGWKQVDTEEGVGFRS